MSRPDSATDAPGIVPGRRTALCVLAATTVAAVLSFWYRYVDVLARGRYEPFQIKLIEEFTGVYGAALLLLPVVWLTRRLRWRGVPWHLQVLYHAGTMAAFCGLHTLMLWSSRMAIFPLAGLGPYDYGAMPLRFAMEIGIQIPIYVLAVGGTLAVDHVRESRTKDLRVARLEAELARARLVNLEHQLRPHFLFNALNTVSSVMYEDRDRADRILSDLASFLRRSLHTSDTQEVPLEEELESLELLLGIARARFEDRLDVRVEAEPEALSAAVPAQLLQPLVENAFQHGDPGEGRLAVVRVAAAVEASRLVLRVTDNGPGADAPLAVLTERGIGLGNTRRRLELLYPGNHRFALDGAPQGGFSVRIEIPCHAASPSAATGTLLDRAANATRAHTAAIGGGAAVAAAGAVPVDKISGTGSYDAGG